ncbi:translation initiation factor IF-2 [Sphaerochaeta sp. PS]|uniref:translation initiation factor IF-2 n=1 Tax=Sphaerochaeta sp. PS TaxID=3076336 RepID=UPI0028A428F7|nr:translation initiation factor IF-2 [Sphaerochaeta sp. PS]MDT4761482.1 translation initiation factor IF-2 [Sphaerochaeta sp. PS]
MTEENNKPKATLIKHVVNPSETKEEKTASPVESDTKPKAPEKRRVVVVKKKVVVVKPQARPAASSSTPDSPGSESESKAAGQKRTSTLRKTVRSTGDRINSSPLHTGPVVIRPTNLPPVPNQGQTVKDHAEWQSKNPDGVAPTPAPPSNGPRIAGTVGGKPAPGTRPAYQGNRTGGGYQGNNPRPAGAGGYQGNNPRPEGGGGYQGNNPRPEGSGGYQGNNPRPEGSGGYQGYNPRPAGTGYQGNNPRPAGTGYQGNNPRPAGTGGYQGNNPRPAGAGGYQGNNPRPAGTGGYQGYNPRPAGTGGYQGGGAPRPAGTGYQPRQGGFQQRPGAPGGRPPFNRPGTGGKPGSGSSEGQDLDALNQRTPKKTFKKKTSASYKKRNAEEEKEFQIQRRKEQAAAKLASVPKHIDMMEVITVSDLAKKMNLKASEIIAKLFKMGMMVTINQQIDYETAEIICSDYNCDVHLVSLYDETLISREPETSEDFVHRAPIVTVMGHVDHGKTKLLDAIRSTKVADGEFGGITQHIGAYKVSLEGRGDVVFLDTPGHAAFSMMRARGAQVTDIVILVVAANDGVMPQTREAIDHARAANVPIVVAINKCDLPEAKPERVMQQLSDLGLMPEAWGGQTLYCQISALKKIGIEELLDTVLLQAEMLELKVNANCRAEGKVIESRIDQGRGIVASVLIERGTLHQGDYYVAGIYPGRVRAMFDDKGNKIDVAGPATPVEIIGLSDIPGAGDPFQVTEDERQARQVGAKRQELERVGDSRNVKKITLDNLYSKIKEGSIQEFNVIIKGDVQGSVEALQGTLDALSNDEIHLNVIRASAGAIIESDITLASASNALVIGFNVRPTPRAQALADQEKIEIRKYNIIYDAVDDVRDAMEGMLTPDIREVEIGTVEVRETFKVPKIGTIAGAMVTHGKVKRNSLVRVIRDSIQLNPTMVKISSLKRFKDDAREVTEGFECGIGLEGFHDLRAGDILEIVETEEVARKLEKSVKV